MEVQPYLHTPVAVSVARLLTRLVTWGIEPRRRNEFLSESDTDWDLMHRDLGSRRVLARALRGIPAAVLGRMNDRDSTAVPTALALSVMAVAGTGAGLMAHTYPVDVRLWTLLGSIGLAGGGVVFLRSPRQIRLEWLRWPVAILAIAVIGIARTMPTEADWPYDYPFVDTALGDVLMMTGFITVAAGCVLIVTASAAPWRRRRLALLGGTISCVGIVLFGTGQIIWGLMAAQVDIEVTIAALGVGLGSYALAHVLPRLRHLEIT